MSLEVDTSAPPPLGAPSIPSLPPPSSSASASNLPMITEGCLSQILLGNPPQTYPILQVLKVRESKSETGQSKFRMVLSDGINFLLVLPASATFELIQKELKTLTFCLIEASSYSLNASGKRKVLCLLQFRVVSGPVAKIGAPCSLDSPGEDSAMDEGNVPAAKPPPQPQHQQQQPQQPQQPQQRLLAPPPPQQQQQQSRPQQQPLQGRPQQPFVPPTQQRPAPQQNHQFQSNNRPASQPQQQQQQQLQQYQQPQQQQYQKQFQPRPAAGNNAGFQAKRPVQQNQSPLISADSPVQVHPIASLNPFQNKWVIKARVTAKSEIRTWSNQRGEGRLFSVDLLDQTGEIRAVGFNEAVDNLYEVLQVGKVYYIARCSLKSGNSKFSTIQNNYELGFDSKSEVVPCNDQTDDVPTINFSFVQIDHIENIAPNTMIDLLCVVVEADEIVNATTKKGDTPKRNLTLVDATGASIKLTVWGAHTETMEVENFPVYALKSLRISDFNGRTLSTTAGTTFFINPDIREAHDLKAWYDNSRDNVQFKNLSVNTPKGSSFPKKTFQQVRDEGLGQSEEPDNFYVKACVLNIPSEDRTIAYPGCPTEGCSKKVIEESVGQWHCEKCNMSFPNCVYRFSLSVNLADFTGQSWSRAFGNVSEILLGVTADTAMNMKLNNDPAFLSVFQEALFKPYNLRIRAKLETFNDVQKAGLQIMNAYPVDYVKDSKVLLDAISKYDQ